MNIFAYIVVFCIDVQMFLVALLGLLVCMETSGVISLISDVQMDWKKAFTSSVSFIAVKKSSLAAVTAHMTLDIQSAGETELMKQ